MVNNNQSCLSLARDHSRQHLPLSPTSSHHATCCTVTVTSTHRSAAGHHSQHHSTHRIAAGHHSQHHSTHRSAAGHHSQHHSTHRSAAVCGASAGCPSISHVCSESRCVAAASGGDVFISLVATGVKLKAPQYFLLLKLHRGRCSFHRPFERKLVSRWFDSACRQQQSTSISAPLWLPKSPSKCEAPFTDCFAVCPLPTKAARLPTRSLH